MVAVGPRRIARRQPIIEIRAFTSPPIPARVNPGTGGRIIETTGAGQGIGWDTQRPFAVKMSVAYGEGIGFFRSFDIGYIGQVDVLNEIR